MVSIASVHAILRAPTHCSGRLPTTSSSTHSTPNTGTEERTYTQDCGLREGSSPPGALARVGWGQCEVLGLACILFLGTR